MPDNIGEILNDKEFQNFFEQFASSMMGGEGSKEGVDETDANDMMKNLMDEFTGFMKQNEGNEEIKNEFETMMKQMISKEALYQPMSDMKAAYPKFLEENAEKLSPEELERYNKQLDTVEEIVKCFDENGKQEDVIELINKLQDLGNPPPEIVAQVTPEVPNMNI